MTDATSTTPQNVDPSQALIGVISQEAGGSAQSGDVLAELQQVAGIGSQSPSAKRRAIQQGPNAQSPSGQAPSSGSSGSSGGGFFSGLTSSATDLFVRGAVVALGLIFIVAGLMMFKSTQVVVQTAAKGAAAVAG